MARLYRDLRRVITARRPETITLAVSGFILAILNIPFWTLYLRAVAPHTASEWLYVAATAAALFLILNLALTALAVRPVFRVLMAVLLPITAAASYFMHEYGVVIDVNMVRNIFATNSAEAGDLFTIKMLLAVVLFGIAPALTVWRLPWIPRTRREDTLAKLKVLAISLPLIILLLFPYWGNVLSLFRDHKELQLTLTPSNYIGALSKFVHGKRLGASVAVAAFGDDARPSARALARTRKSLFVIVVGETARAGHFQLNGYPRPTNPELSKITGLINYPNAFSCGTDTAQSVPCMFSGLGRDNFSNTKASARENLLDILKRAGFDVIWRENQAGCKGVCDRVTSEVLTGLKHPTFYAQSENYDEILIDGLEQRIAKLGRNTVIVMHMMGSHGPAYWKRYPERFEVFKPVCQESQFSRCTRDEIINAYDNTILYTDYVLGRLAAILGSATSHNVDAGMIYISDHGESLGENNLYLHGMPYPIAPDAQIHVPMTVWLSPEFEKSFAVDRGCLAGRAADKAGHDNLFHSVLGLLDVTTIVYNPVLDLFAPCRPKPAL